MIVEEGDAGFGGALDHDALNGGAGAVAARVEDSGSAVSALPPEGDGALGRVEGNAEFDERADMGGGFLDEHLDGGGVAEAGAGAEGVFAVLGGTVAGADGGGDAALGAGAVGLGDRPFAQDADGSVLRREEGGVQPGDPGAQDEVVVRHAAPRG